MIQMGVDRVLMINYEPVIWTGEGGPTHNRAHEMKPMRHYQRGQVGNRSYVKGQLIYSHPEGDYHSSKAHERCKLKHEVEVLGLGPRCSHKGDIYR